MSLRNVADFSLKEGSRIFKQRAPEQDLSNFSLETERNASRARRRGDLPAGKAGRTSASPHKKSRSPIWCPRQESNPQPSAPQADALSG